MKATFRTVVIALLPCSAIASQQNCDPVQVERSWSQCSICHSVTKRDDTKFGPNLHGVLGRMSGSLLGYVFSTAMTQSRLKWTPGTIDLFLTDPQTLVPGNDMPYGPVSDPGTRAAIICKLANSNN
ncbi:cytochrome c class I [Pseudomonas sp. HMWF031]|nr:cytochrome c class I [Pseudomonas sp. HMWF031]